MVKMSKKEAMDGMALTVGFMSLFVFFYRLIQVAIPAFKEGFEQRDFQKLAEALTMLV
tara:strand:- start:132 stop:305 length:174 start_codon:yes stop_codon:yes gene_type:complete